MGLPVQVERPRALAEEEQRLSAEVGRAPLEQRSRLSISAGDGVANMASQALEEARSGVAGEASLRQDTSGLGAERNAGATGGQIGDAAYAAAGSALERVDAGIRSAFATPRSSQPTLRSFFGSQDGAVPSPTQLPRGLRWLEGVGSMFRGSGENQGAGSLLAPIVNMPSATYGAVAMGPRAPEGPNQQMVPFPGGARQATAGYQGVSLASLQGHMGAEQASSHSSLPHNAIQAEVSRQLQGLLSRVRAAEDENRLLRSQLASAMPEGRDGRVPQGGPGVGVGSVP